MESLKWIGAATLITVLLLNIMAISGIPVVAQDEDTEENEGAEVPTHEENELSEISELEENEVEEVPEVEENRELEVSEIDENEIEIEAQNPDEENPEEIEDMFKLKASTKEGVEFKMEYTDKVQRVDNQVVEQEIELEFEVEFDAVIEFVDNNGNGLYDKGEEVYEYDLDEVEFLPISRETEIVDSTTVHKITIQTAGNVFKVVLHATDKPVIISGENVKPNEVKITVEIDNFLYKRDNSKLALKTEFKSEMEASEEVHGVEGEDEGEVEVTYGDYAGFFSWKQTALVDGAEQVVKSTSLTDDPEEGDRELYLIYERGNAIVHDPKIGVLGAVGVPAAISWETVIVSAIVAALVSMAVTGFMMRHVLRKKIR